MNTDERQRMMNTRGATRQEPLPSVSIRVHLRLFLFLEIRVHSRFGKQKAGTVPIRLDRPSRPFVEPENLVRDFGFSAPGSPDPGAAWILQQVMATPLKAWEPTRGPSPDGPASFPGDRSPDRRSQAATVAKRAPRQRSRAFLCPCWLPFPPTGGPTSGNWLAPPSWRSAVPRVSSLPVPRPSGKHPPELAVRSGKLGSGGSSSLLNQSQSA
jgi:hypothetical protein